jgi:hypothetical protein
VKERGRGTKRQQEATMEQEANRRENKRLPNQENKRQLEQEDKRLLREEGETGGDKDSRPYRNQANL